MKNFRVYKSSAGSGKTTTLVKEYLKIALQRPESFRNLLAITFTNKASREMKDRIIGTLEKYSMGEADDAFSRDIMNETGLTVEQITERAGELLSQILHHYDDFSVSTIDSFVHQVVRSFSTDLKLPQGFEIVIDEDDIIPFIVEGIYDKLGTDKAFTEILLEFARKRVDDERGYDPTEELARFIKKQLKEEGFHEIKKLEHYSTKDFLIIIKKLQASLFSTKEIMIKTASEAYNLIEQRGLDASDFYQGKNGVKSYLQRIAEWPQNWEKLFPNSYIKRAIEEDVWYSAKLDSAKSSSIDEIAPRLKTALQEITGKVSFYAIRKLVYDNIYELALLREIRLIFDEYTAKTQKVHISEFNKRIYEEVASQPVPFIYERIGRRYRNFLIDEFQDTSVLQWNNLLPLIDESLSNGNFNMLVGDAKQAIYRFRSGEVELFTHLPKLFLASENPENAQREQNLVNNYDEQKLEINYRSREEIIGFNNRFFDFAGKKLKENFGKVYEEQEQNLPEKKKEGGYISIQFLESESASDYREKVLVQIVENVQKLVSEGYPVKDICILTRTNQASAEIASNLVSLGIPVVSSESLKLSVSPLVRMLVAFLKLLSEPNDQLAFAEFLTPFLVLRNSAENFHSIFTEAVMHPNRLVWFLEKYNVQLPSAEALRQKSVYEILDEVAPHLADVVSSDVFLQFFLDFAYEKRQVYRSSIEAFIELWEEKKSDLSIVMPEGLEAVQVMTAHKAKGLKFGTVIVDLYNNKNTNTRGEFWMDIDFPELKELNIGLLKIGKSLSLVDKGEIYEYESAKTELDYLNLVYVAFTRAVDALEIVCFRKEDKGDKFSEWVRDFLVSNGQWQEGKQVYEFGNFETIGLHQEQVEKKQVEEPISVPSAPWNKHIAVAPVEDVFWEAFGKKPARTYGNLIHEMLSKIEVISNIDRVVEGYHLSGLIDAEELPEISKLLHHLISIKEVAPYFQDGLFVKIESEIFDAENKRILRPDRVVQIEDKLAIIDYKTGEKRHEHIRQVENYAAVFKKMGYEHIDKILIYINEEIEVVPV
ncbi:MAG: UvrD-helicase domain-containing protein [Bacteroidales bacterium]|nr:UvrD-helicase domain-containing protein [Bacteroidales bacterium]